MSWGSARYAQLFRICRRRGCSYEDAEELVQEAYLRFFEFQRFAKVRDADSLLRRIAINLSISLYHRQRSMPAVFSNINELDRRGLLIDSAVDPERTLHAQLELERVVQVLGTVSLRTCQVFIAQRGGYSYEEIANAFAVKPRTIEKHVASAVLALKEMGSANIKSSRRSAPTPVS